MEAGDEQVSRRRRAMPLIAATPPRCLLLHICRHDDARLCHFTLDYFD